MSRRNSRHETFCREYIIDLNGTRAAIAAGYAKKGAHVTASRMLSNPKVQARLAELQKEKFETLDMAAEKVLVELDRLGFSNILDYMRTTESGDAYIDLSKLTREQAAAIQQVTVDEYTEGRGEGARQVKRTRIKLADKLRALELRGKHERLFTDRVEVTDTTNYLIEQLEAARKRVEADERGD